jgi:sterol desaturase/sphingolipid hydroxylase (fatty acid hydroxylase superfamily)
MDKLIIDSEPVIRLASFVGVIVVMLAWETLAPRRRPATPRLQRWVSNLGLVAIDAAVLRLVFPVVAVGAAAWAEAAGIGLFNARPGLAPAWLAFIATLLVLDLAIWAQHFAMHKVPWLWRLHRVHHSDVDYDTTTGVRFHPIEIAASMLYKIAIVVALGAPAAAVLAFEVVLSATSLFNHGNVRLPTKLDRPLRLVIVTPDMHRVHHSWHREETDSNYGFNLSVWDRLFGTYRAQPRDGHTGMTIGLHAFRAGRDGVLDRLLVQPFASARVRPADRP